MNLILIHPSEIDAANRVVLADGRARHIIHVLKATPGKKLRIGRLNGPLGEGRIERVEGSAVVLECTFETAPPERPQIDLVLALPRPKVMKRLWAQLAELGIGRIVLLRAEKVERCYFDSHVVEPGFFNELLFEGLQQARCTHLPEVLVRPLFKPFVEDELDGLFASHQKLLADPAGAGRLDDVFQPGRKTDRAVLAIGPEGGWTTYELDMLRTRGFGLFGMGERILRTDTATIGLLSMLADRMHAR